jgi:hypothetical protein
VTDIAVVLNWEIKYAPSGSIVDCSNGRGFLEWETGIRNWTWANFVICLFAFLNQQIVIPEIKQRDK